MELYILQDKHKASWTVKTMDYRNATVHAIYAFTHYTTHFNCTHLHCMPAWMKQ